MSSKDLKKKPLVEAILELRWVMPSSLPIPGIEGDPHYRLLLGRFSERVQEEYPFHESLPTAQIPDGMVVHLPQHRFRIAQNDWPLLQMGPGIMTVNDTSKYTWTDFEGRCVSAVKNIFEAHPNREAFKIQDLTLRYIDAIPFDYNEDSILSFLKTKLKTNISLPAILFKKTGVKDKPSAFNWQVSFAQEKPGGTVILRFATGQKEGVPALIWETLIQSSGEHLPDMPDGFPEWLTGAHAITDDWFFKLIEGDLERLFS